MLFEAHQLIIYRASKLGMSLRELVAIRLGFDREPFPDDLQIIMNEGKLHERDVLRQLTARGWEITDAQDNVNSIGDYQIELDLPVTSSVVVRGHCDSKAVEVGTNSQVIVEVKAPGDSTWKEINRLGWDAGGLMPRYKWQISCYMHAANLPALLVYKNRANGKIEILRAPVPFYSKAQIIARVLQAEAWVRKGQLPPCDMKSYPCPFSRLCDLIEHRQGVDNPEVEQIAREYVMAKAIEKQAQADSSIARMRVEELREQLGKACGHKRMVGERLTAGKAKVTWFVAKNSKASFQREKAEEELGIDLGPYYVQGESERLRVEIND